MTAQELVRRLKAYPEKGIRIQTTHIKSDGSESTEYRDLQADDISFMENRWTIRTIKNV